ncbi:PhoH family protein [Desulfovibrio cuneatus]|uniref:PhoH family protein n=1 Tax=Desulfovibrio cuneatus TaxID=159728 RepID=UPI00040F79CE|nr:PhoH family protein [Desulfovibrio cuneatus]
MQFDEAPLANQLFGPQNSHISLLAELSGLELATTGTTLVLRGEEDALQTAKNLLLQLYALAKSGATFSPQDIRHAWGALRRAPGTDIKKVFLESVFIASPRKTIAPKTLSQRLYVDAVRNHDLTIAEGPAGTGKTYLAVAIGLSMLVAKRVRRIVLTRPAVEAGERLGFLPGDMAQKVNPYLRPLYDALHDMLDFDRVTEMMETGVIEIAPLAFMRGRTLSNAFIILDEAQNTTVEQMKMFVTRLGYGSRAVITGDTTQIDLPENGRKTHSGLVQILDVLNNVEGVAQVRFHHEDVIRHPLVGRIIHAYEQYEKSHTR